jgi:hypothetical protein
LEGNLDAKNPAMNSEVSNSSGMNLLEFVSSYLEIPVFGGQKGISSFHRSRLQRCQLQDAKEKVAQSIKDYIRKNIQP